MTPRCLLLILLVAVCCGVLFLAACANNSTAVPATPDSPNLTAPPVTADPAALLLQERCADCHSLQRVVSAHKTKAEWERSVQRMVNKGAQLSDAEFAALVEYLAANYQ